MRPRASSGRRRRLRRRPTRSARWRRTWASQPPASRMRMRKSFKRLTLYVTLDRFRSLSFTRFLTLDLIVGFGRGFFTRTMGSSESALDELGASAFSMNRSTPAITDGGRTCNSAPARSNARAQSRLPPSRAARSDVFRSRRFVVPVARSSWTISVCPSRHALCRGVPPSSGRRSTSAPAASKSETIAACRR